MDENGNNKRMNKPVRVINFNADYPQDRELINKANIYGQLPRNRGISLASLIRNLLDRTLDSELNASQILGQSQQQSS